MGENGKDSGALSKEFLKTQSQALALLRFQMVPL